MLAQDMDDPMLLKPAPRSAALAMLWQIPGAKLVTAVGSLWKGSMRDSHLQKPFAL
jgi:hypothetical protein